MKNTCETNHPPCWTLQWRRQIWWRQTEPVCVCVYGVNRKVNIIAKKYIVYLSSVPKQMKISIHVFMCTIHWRWNCFTCNPPLLIPQFIPQNFSKLSPKMPSKTVKNYNGTIRNHAFFANGVQIVKNMCFFFPIQTQNGPAGAPFFLSTCSLLGIIWRNFVV